MTYKDMERQMLEKLKKNPVRFIKYYIEPSHLDGFPTYASKEVDEVDWNDDSAVYFRQELIK